MAGAARNDARSLNLPDFCAARAVLAVVLIVTLTAIVLTVAHQSSGLNFWLDLARTSLFLLWAGMGSAAALCLLRARLAQLPLGVASALALGSVLAVIALVSLRRALARQQRAARAARHQPAAARARRRTSSPPTSASARSSARSRCAISTSPANGAATSNCRRAPGCARCRRASVRISCSTA